MPTLVLLRTVKIISGGCDGPLLGGAEPNTPAATVALETPFKTTESPTMVPLLDVVTAVPPKMLTLVLFRTVVIAWRVGLPKMPTLLLLSATLITTGPVAVLAPNNSVKTFVCRTPCRSMVSLDCPKIPTFSLFVTRIEPPLGEPKILTLVELRTVVAILAVTGEPLPKMPTSEELATSMRMLRVDVEAPKPVVSMVALVTP